MAKKATKPVSTGSASTAAAPAPIKKSAAPRAKKHVVAQVAETAVAAGPANAEPVTAIAPAKAVTHEAISRLAYQFYLDRGGRGGSPAEDWTRAEKTLTAAV